MKPELSRTPWSGADLVLSEANTVDLRLGRGFVWSRGSGSCHTAGHDPERPMQTDTSRTEAGMKVSLMMDG